MKIHSPQTKQKVRELRQQGHTYGEIQDLLGQKIPKSTLTYLCKGITLSDAQLHRIDALMQVHRAEARKKAVVVNRQILEAKVEGYRIANEDLTNFMQDRRAKFVALAILYLGEGAKWQGSRAPKLASSNPLIINLYIDLLRECYEIPVTKLKARVQHRADQDPQQLLRFWADVTKIPPQNFYRSYVDKRTVGKPTTKSNYQGVCSIGCAGTHIQLELQEIAGIISGALRGIGAVG